MKRRSITFILLAIIWFIGTNHCAFESCLTHAALDSAADSSAPLQSHHEHGDQDSHPCGVPCKVGVALSPTEISVAKVIVLPDQLFGAALSFIFSPDLDLQPFLADRSNDADIRGISNTLVYVLQYAPNAPPFIQS